MYKAEGLLVVKDGAVEYECETEQEAIDIAQAANSFTASNGRDHERWNELVEHMNWDTECPNWL